jgi:myosin protein heavy chain
MKLPKMQIQKIIVPTVALAIGLTIGLGTGYFQIKKEQKISQGKIAEANKKVAFMQKRMTEEKSESASSLEQQYRSDLEKIEKEKAALGGQVGKFKAQVQTLEVKISETEKDAARLQKELQEQGSKYAHVVQQNKDLDGSLKKVTGEKQALHAGLQKTTKDLGQCAANNARLSVLSEELLKKYRNKGLGTILIANEPLTQIKKVELEKLTQQYQEEIEQQKIKNNSARGKNADE